jgi:hypothetical protein
MYGIDASCTFNSNDPCQADGKSANSSTSIVDASIEFLRETQAITPTPPPFYLNVWLHVSHNLLNPSAEQKAACVQNSERCMCDHLSDNETSCVNQIFWAAQQDADAQIGRLFDVLSELKLDESTFVVFTTDNGPEERLVYVNAGGNAGPFRGRKRSLYEGGIRVPFIAWWGGGSSKPTIASNVIDNTLIGGVDWMPTVLALAGVALPEGLAKVLDGVDMSGVFLRKDVNASRSPSSPQLALAPVPRPLPRPYLFWQWRFPVAGTCDNFAPPLAVRDGRYKLLMDPPTYGAGARVELYDLSLFNSSFDEGSSDTTPRPDFHEDFNLARIPGAPYAAIVQRLTAALVEWHGKQPKSSITNGGSCANFPYPGITAVGEQENDFFHGMFEDSEPDW